MGLAVVSAWMHHRDRETAWLGTWCFRRPHGPCALVCFWGVSNIGTPILPVYFESDLDLARQALYSLFAFFLLLPAVFGPQGRGAIRRLLQWWPMASLGAISYGIYLSHETWIYRILGAGGYREFNLEFWAFFLSVLGLSIISASLSYFIVEKPALRLKDSIAWWRRAAPGPGRTGPRPPTTSPRPAGSGQAGSEEGGAPGGTGTPAVADPLDQAVGAEQAEGQPDQGVGPTGVRGPVDVRGEGVVVLVHGHVGHRGQQQAHGAGHHHHPAPVHQQLDQDEPGGEQASQGRHHHPGHQAPEEGDAQRPAQRGRPPAAQDRGRHRSFRVTGCSGPDAPVGPGRLGPGRPRGYRGARRRRRPAARNRGGRAIRTTLTARVAPETTRAASPPAGAPR